jgi:hypothetical protein
MKGIYGHIKQYRTHSTETSFAFNSKNIEMVIEADFEMLYEKQLIKKNKTFTSTRNWTKFT